MVIRTITAFALTLLSFTAQAIERITDYSVEIVVRTDGDLLVTERITVTSEGEQIKRGIYRDFPTVRGRSWWGKYRTGFDVVSVQRDGKDEPWFTKPIIDGVRLYTGDANVLLSTGTHTFGFTYRTDRQIGFFGDRDELYWNVTGNFWAFPITQASVTVKLPEGAAALDFDVFTGRVGAAEKNATIASQGGVVTARTTKSLQRGEGLTIGVAFTPNVIERAALSDRMVYLLRDNLGAVIGFCGLLILLIYYLNVWSRYGRDPEAGTIAPEYYPPKGLSAAACRYVRDMGWDDKAFTAAIVSLGAKGYVTMGEVKGGLLKDGHFFITRTKLGERDAGLSDGETQLAKALFKGWDSIPFLPEHRKTIMDAQGKLRANLRQEFDSVYFVLNRGTLGPGIAISVLTALGVALTADDPATFGFGLLVVALIAMMVMAFVFRTVHAFQVATSVVKRVFLFAPFGFIFWILAAFGPMPLLNDLVHRFDIIDFLIIAIMAAVNVVFFNLMEAPTRLGRSVMNHIEGFKHYLTVAEKDRLNFHNPPDLTPEVFEKMLPYAIALDVEHEWGEQFDAAMERAVRDGAATPYTKPKWYDSPSYTHGSMTNFASGLQGTIATSVATAVTPPSSGGSGGGGGFRGGGFSGGGGGGGGGGGW